jgi:flagellin
MPVIATNTSANTALIYLNNNSRAMDKSLAKLSSGSRIVRASDDAAGLAVGSSLKADITTLKQGAINAVQARSVLQTADGALARVGDILQRMKSLTAQAVSGSVDATSRGFIDQEYDALKAEAIAIGTNTTFNGTALLTGNYNATNNVATFQVGIAVGDTIVADLTTVVVTAAVMTSLAANTDTAANAIRGVSAG